MVEINEVYKPLYTSKKRYFLITGGRGSLKSTSVHDFVQRLSYEKGHGILFTRYTMASAEKSIIPEFLIVAKRNNSISDFTVTKNKITNNLTGSFIIFSGIKTSSGDQTANLKSIAGITTWVIDEGEDFTDEKTFDDIDDSVRSTENQNRVIWIQNPSTKEHFIYKRWIEQTPGVIKVKTNLKTYDVTVSNHEDVEHIHTTYEIARKFLSDSFLRKADKQETEQPKRFYHKYIGGWLEKAEGVVYENWKIGEFEEADITGYGLDFGSNDPDALTKCSIDFDNRRIYLKQEYFKSDTDSQELFDVLVDRCGYDNLIIGDTSGRRLIKQYYKHGLNIRRASKKDKLEQIKVLQSWDIIVDKDSSDLIVAFNNYAFHDQKAGIINHDYSDLMDSFRYFCWNFLKKE